MYDFAQAQSVSSVPFSASFGRLTGTAISVTWAAMTTGSVAAKHEWLAIDGGYPCAGRTAAWVAALCSR